MRYFQNAAGVLDCIVGLELHGKAKVNNARVFYEGQDVQIFRNLKESSLGVMKIVDIKEKKKQLTLACFDGTVTVPRVGDLILVSD